MLKSLGSVKKCMKFSVIFSRKENSAENKIQQKIQRDQFFLISINLIVINASIWFSSQQLPFLTLYSASTVIYFHFRLNETIEESLKEMGHVFVVNSNRVWANHRLRWEGLLFVKKCGLNLYCQLSMTARWYPMPKSKAFVKIGQMIPKNIELIK